MDVTTDSQCSEFTVTHHHLLDQSMNSVPVLSLKSLKWSQEGCPVGDVMDLATLLMDTLLFHKVTVLCSTLLKDTPHSIHNEQWFKNLQYVQMITHWDTDDNDNSVSHYICWHVSVYLWTVVISAHLPVVSMNSHPLLYIFSLAVCPEVRFTRCTTQIHHLKMEIYKLWTAVIQVYTRNSTLYTHAGTQMILITLLANKSVGMSLCVSGYKLSLWTIIISTLACDSLTNELSHTQF